LRSHIKSTQHTLEQLVLHCRTGHDLLVTRVICGESSKMNRRRRTFFTRQPRWSLPSKGTVYTVHFGWFNRVDQPGGPV